MISFLEYLDDLQYHFNMDYRINIKRFSFHKDLIQQRTLQSPSTITCFASTGGLFLTIIKSDKPASKACVTINKFGKLIDIKSTCDGLLEFL